MQPQELSDEDLMAQLQADSPHALRGLMERYRSPLYGYLYRMLASSEDAEDLFQESFLRVLRHADRFQPGRPFRPWLYAIATNLVKNAYRSRGYREAVPLDRSDYEDGTPLAARLAAIGEQPSEPVEREESRRLVRQAVETLPEKGRAALVLYYFQGLAYEEVADTLEIPLGTVKSRIHNAMARLGRTLGPKEETS